MLGIYNRWDLIYTAESLGYIQIKEIEMINSDDLDNIVRTDVSEVIDEPRKELRDFFKHVYFIARELLQSEDALYFTRDFTSKYAGASKAYILDTVRKWNMTREQPAS